MTTSSHDKFKPNYQTLLKHLKLKGLQPKTIEAYSRGIRRISEYFDYQISDLSEKQLVDYFSDLLKTHSWTTLKLDLYGLKFYYQYVLRKTWVNIDLINAPRAQRLPDIVTCEKGKVTFRYQNSKTTKMEYKTVTGANFLWLVLQHVLPKGFHRARNYGFLHPNSKRRITLIQLILKFDPNRALAWMKKRPQWLCSCCGAKMKIIETRLAPLFSYTRWLPT